MSHTEANTPLQLFNPDPIATRIDIQFHSDARDALLKAIAE
jgi:hypothetical protein